jgi:transcriptional regulator with XRE-family HTH domain
MQNVIKRFIQARKHLRLTQADLATSLGFKQSYISNIEKGRNEVTSNIVIAMYKLYSISPEWLITGQGEIMSRFTHQGTLETPTLESNTDDSNSAHEFEPNTHETLRDLVKAKEMTIQMQEKVIALQESEIARLKRIILTWENSNLT